MDLVEVTDEEAPAHSCDDWCVRINCSSRPNQTIADWIADAAIIGDVEITPFIKIKGLGGERCPMKACVLCNTEPTLVQEFAQSARAAYAQALEDFETYWDPTITL